ncbi:MobA/MobL family protein [Aeromonas sp. EERV15]|uniref:MobA/MobL family protein n=2 Tax=Aeromonadaceae TaxID=84642 RepID=UPI0009F631BC|nr:MobA/MobL family protein [Aeromonas sp. EERV15]
MANYHLSLTNGSKEAGKSGKIRNDYIKRENKYAKKNNELLYSDCGNIPHWAKSDSEFWHAADLYERSNARVYREIECSLPNELTIEQQKELVKSFVRCVTEKEGFPWSLGIHEGKSQDIGKPNNPHFHLIFNERISDGIERTAATHFKRYNKKSPKKGGAEKSKVTRETEWLNELRKNWADMQNAALEKAGVKVRVDHRSLAEQGIDRLPTTHLGVKSVAMKRRGITTNIFDFNKERGLLISEMQILKKEINFIDDKLSIEKGLKEEKAIFHMLEQLKAMCCQKIDIKIENKNEIKDLHMNEAENIAHLLLKENADKHNIEIKPSISEHSGMLFVSDTSDIKLKVLNDAGFNAAAIIETRHGVYDAWIKIAERLDPEITREAAHLLEEEFNVDVSSSRYGKLSGFNCHKDGESFFARCIQATGLIAKRGRQMIEKVQKKLEIRKNRLARLTRITAWIHIPYKKLSFIDKCIQVYQPLVKKFHDDLEQSDITFAEIMIKNGYSEKLIMKAIIELSPALTENADEYAKNVITSTPTIRFILKHKGDVIEW